MQTVKTPENMSGLRLVVYVRVSREDERPENQEYAIQKWAAEMEQELVCQRIKGDPRPPEGPGRARGEVSEVVGSYAPPHNRSTW